MEVVRCREMSVDYPAALSDAWGPKHHKTKFLVSASEIFSDLLRQLLRHRLFPAQHSTDIRPSDAEHLCELVSATDLLLKPPQIFKRLVHRRGYWIGFLAQRLSGAEKLHQGSVGYPFALFQARKRVVRNPRFPDECAITDCVLLLNVEHGRGDGTSISQLDPW
jgi:hypothetical protein